MGNTPLDYVLPTDISKTGGLPDSLKRFEGTEVLLRSYINITKGQVNGAIGFVTVTFRPQFRRDQMYVTDIPSVPITFSKDGEHVIKPITVQFPAKYIYDAIERRMLPLMLPWSSTAHKM